MVSAVPGIDPEVPPSGSGCVECEASGGWWLHLRRCAQCGHIGCCDSSPGKHARKHAHDTGHAVVQSYEPREDWLYCFEDDVTFEVEELMDSPSRLPGWSQGPPRTQTR